MIISVLILIFFNSFTEKDLVPTFATFTVCLVKGVEYGILTGVAINIIMLLYPSARPSVKVQKSVVSTFVGTFVFI
jgi:sodium-independent sulfate anion transporter 11